MYTSLKYASAVSVVLSVLNAVAAVLVLMYLAPMEDIGFTFLIMIGGFMITTSVVLLIISFALWNLYEDLRVRNDSNFEDIAQLKKRVEQLEKK